MVGSEGGLKLLHIIPYYEPAVSYGGPVRSVSSLCKALVRLGAEVSVFTTNADGQGTLTVPLGKPVDCEGVKVYYFPRENPRSFYRCPALLNAARERIHEYGRT